MKTRLLTLFACLFLFTGLAVAQTNVTGTVISKEDGQPIIGATVQIVGSGSGTVTDVDGKFMLNMPHNKKLLRISYVGMEPLDIEAKPVMKVVMTPLPSSLDEVIVVAYGTAKKSAFTGSAGLLKEDEIGKVQVTNPVDALRGKVSGVQMTRQPGQPGVSNPTILIRGISSINSGTAPLIILDGVPFDGDMNTLNPADIESETVLKDAASAALYGARGANGVIIITTKNGRKDHASVTFDAKWGSNSRMLPDYEYINHPAAYYEMWYKGLYNYAVDKRGNTSYQAFVYANQKLTSNDNEGLGYNVYNLPGNEFLIGQNGKLNPKATLGNVITAPDGTQYMLYPDKWIDAIYKNSLRQEYNITANASNDKAVFFGSANYLKYDGISPNSDYERLSARAKSDYQLKPWLKLCTNFSYSHYKTNSLRAGGDSGQPDNVFAMARIAPIYPLYLRDAQGNIMQFDKGGIPAFDYGDGGTLGISRAFLPNANGLSDNLLNKNSTEGNTFSAIGSAEIRFLKDFKFTTTNSVYVDEYRGLTTHNPWLGHYAAQKGSVSRSHDRTWNYNYQQLLNWHHQYGVHEVEAMLGHEYYRSRGYNIYGERQKTFSNESTEMNQAILVIDTGSSMGDYNTEGWFGRVQYNYDQRYFGSMSYRRDASSRFDPNHRWGNFWSLGGAWLISKEKWFNAKWVDELKFKASYGEQGNDRIGNYRYTYLYNITNSNGEVAITPATVGNDEITWEKGGNFNSGFDFSFFKSRLTGSIEYFYRTTTDMLAWYTLPGTTGYTGYWKNIGNMANSGLEIELRGDIIRTKDFTWSANFNFTTYRNRITKLAPESKNAVVDGVEGYMSDGYFYGEHQPLNVFRMYRYAGVDHETGEALYYKNVYETDANGKRVLDAKGRPIVKELTKVKTTGEADYYLCGSSLPDGFGGFGTSLNFKGFDFSIDFAYQLGGQYYDGTYAGAMSLSRGYAFHVDLLDAWSPENKNSNIPRIQYNDEFMTAYSDRFLISASYLSLQNITLGYTIPTKLATRFGLEKLRIYAVADNVWLWSKRQGMDPRQSIDGTGNNVNYSPIRTITGGISITF
ncbi:MAG: TonB-dependent receptor [Prevotella sp.]|nr:TonB-dependent receptor [Prevotella sp.]MDY4038553.1 TonB-dependent receptor [Prevotella sp.]